MKINVGNTDKLIRLILALAGLLLYFFKVVSGTPGIVILVIALVLVITSLVRFCPLYTLFGINTCKKSEQK